MTRKTRELRSEEQICQWILGQARKPATCEALDLRFALVRREHQGEAGPSWELRGMSGWTDWPRACREAFWDAVRDAQSRFDILYGPGDKPSLHPPRGDERGREDPGADRSSA